MIESQLANAKPVHKAIERSLEAASRWLETSLLDVRHTDGFDAIIGCEIYEAVLRRLRPGQMAYVQQHLPAVKKAYQAASRPAGYEVALAHVTRLHMAMRHQRKHGEDSEVMIELMAEDIEEFPADVIGEACKRWRRRESWFPASAELRAECQRLAGRRHHVARALVALEQALEARRAAAGE